MYQRPVPLVEENPGWIGTHLKKSVLNIYSIEKTLSTGRAMIMTSSKSPVIDQGRPPGQLSVGQKGRQPPDSKSNPKVFWSYVNSKTKTRSGVNDLTTPDGLVFTIEGDGPLPIPPVYKFSEMLQDIRFTEQDTEEMLSILKTDKAPGPDGLSPLILNNDNNNIWG